MTIFKIKGHSGGTPVADSRIQSAVWETLILQYHLTLNLKKNSKLSEVPPFQIFGGNFSEEVKTWLIQ